MFMDEPFYDDTCLRKIFTGATPHNNGLVKSSSILPRAELPGDLDTVYM